MRVKYIGPHEAVELELGDGRLATVARGDVLETDDEHAAALLEQPSNWEPATPAKKAKAAEAEADTTKDGE